MTTINAQIIYTHWPKELKKLKKKTNYKVNKHQENGKLNSSQLLTPKFLTLNKFLNRDMLDVLISDLSFPHPFPPQLPKCTTRDEYNVTWAEIYR